MSIADKIRKAALGPRAFLAPRKIAPLLAVRYRNDWDALLSWLEYIATTSTAERRFFLLFCAESFEPGQERVTIDPPVCGAERAGETE